MCNIIGTLCKALSAEVRTLLFTILHNAVGRLRVNKLLNQQNLFYKLIFNTNKSEQNQTETCYAKVSNLTTATV